MAGIGRDWISESGFSSSSSKLYSLLHAGEEIAEATSSEGVIEDKVFVAVGKKVSESKSTLLWALQNREGKGICLLHVHQPSEFISVLGGKFPVSSLGEMEVKTHREKERNVMNKILDEYLLICTKAGVRAEKLYIDKDSIEKGIVELVSLHRMGKLVMGGAADGRYSRKMIELKSQKANYVHQHAPAFCHIWFICKQRLIHTRKANRELSTMGQVGQSSSSIPESVARSEDNLPIHGTSSSNATMFSAVETMSVTGTTIDFDQASVISVSQLSTVSSNPESVVGSPLSRNRQRETDFTFSTLPLDAGKSPSPSSLHMLESSINEKLHQQLMQAMEEVEISRKQAFEESMSRQRAEKDTIAVLRRARALESLYKEEVRRRKEIEEELARTTEELENIKNRRDTALEELKITCDQKLILETRVGTSDLFVHELGEKLVSAVQFLQKYKERL